MATQSPADINSAPRHESSFGNLNVYSKTLAVTSLPLNEVLRVLRIPGGNRIVALHVINDDLDSNGAPTAAVKVGYSPVVSADGPTADDDYWAAAGQTWLQSAGNRFATAHPLKIDKDIYVDITASAAAATFAAGSVTVTAYCENIGR